MKQHALDKQMENSTPSKLILETTEERISSNPPREVKKEQPSPNLQAGDFVLLKDESVIRNDWKLGRIVEHILGCIWDG